MKNFTKILSVGLVTALASASLYAQTTGVLQKNSNLRKAPSLDAPIIKIIPKNTQIIILEQHGDWARVGRGYIFTSLIGSTETKETTEQKVVEESVSKPEPTITPKPVSVAKPVVKKVKNMEKEVTLVHQFTSILESGEYLLDAKFVEFDKCDKFGWCKVKGKDYYVKEYLYLKKDDGRYMKRGQDLAYIYKKVAFPEAHNKEEKILNVNDFEGEERLKLNKKKNSKFGYVKLKELMANGVTQKQEETIVTKKEAIQEVMLDDESQEEVETLTTQTAKTEVKKQEPKPEAKKELSADEKRLLELQKLIEQYDKQLADLNSSK